MERSQSIVLIGASAGGVEALLQLAEQLPDDFNAAVLITLHIDSYDGQMPKLMTRRGSLRAAYANDGDIIVPGRIFFAPPDHHLLVDGDTLHLTQSSKENYSRPAIDPMFRSAALSRASGRTIGVILSGMLDDGANGLKVVKDAGGIAVVQDPDEAYAPSMPRAALAATTVDHRVGIAALGALLVRLVASPITAPMTHITESTRTELLLTRGEGHAFELLDQIGKPSSLTCPDCGGALWELHERPPKRFRCHTGHAFTLRALEHAQSELANASMWATLRSLNEKRALLCELADSYHEQADDDGAAAARDLAAQVGRVATELRSMLESLPGSSARITPAP